MTDVLIAIGSGATVLLALATVWLGYSTKSLLYETKRGREEAKLDQEAAALQSALVEQVENCRQWHSHQPNRGGAIALVPLKDWWPAFTELRKLLASVRLPGDLVAYLVWLTAQANQGIAELQPRIAIILRAHDAGNYDAATQAWIINDTWDVELDRLQIIASLLCDEAARRGLNDVADGFRPASPWLPWLKPTPWPLGKNRTATFQTDPIYRFAPPFPSGPAYANSSAVARDEYANQLHAQTQAALYRSISHG